LELLSTGNLSEVNEVVDEQNAVEGEDLFGKKKTEKGNICTESFFK
jgi:hypothetical protein